MMRVKYKIEIYKVGKKAKTMYINDDKESNKEMFEMLPIYMKYLNYSLHIFQQIRIETKKLSQFDMVQSKELQT
jgi:hypothetical protein